MMKGRRTGELVMLATLANGVGQKFPDDEPCTLSHEWRDEDGIFEDHGVCGRHSITAVLALAHTA